MTSAFTAWQRDSTTGEVVFDASGYPVPLPNPSANTYGDMQARVQYECLGPATTSDVQNAIQDAISEFEMESFWFNEMRYFGGLASSLSDLATIPGREFYSYQDLPMLIAMPHVRSILVEAYNNRYELILRTQQWIDAQSVSITWQGWPTDYAFVAGGLRLYPTPSQSFPLIVTGTIRFPPLVAPTDTNPWMVEAEPLIRTEAKRLLFLNVNRDADQAAVCQAQIYGTPTFQGTAALGIQGYLAQLRRETQRRAGGTGRIRPSRGYFS